MAIIKCPECGENISTEAKHCVHCGCVVSVCKECGAAFVGKVDICPECGYSINVEPNLDNSEKTKYNKKGIKHINELREQWDTEGKRLRFFKARKVVKVFSYIITIITALIIVLFRISNLFGVLMLSMHSIIISCLGNYFSENESLFISFDYGMWMKKKKLNYKKVIDEFFNSKISGFSYEERSNAAEVVKNLGISAMFDECPEKKRKFILNGHLKTLLLNLSVSTLIFFLYINLSNVIHDIIENFTSANFFVLLWQAITQLEYWWIFIAFVVFIVAYIIVGAVIQDKEDKIVEKWFEEKYPEYYSSYLDNVKNISENKDGI